METRFKGQLICLAGLSLCSGIEYGLNAAWATFFGLVLFHSWLADFIDAYNARTEVKRYKK